MRARTGTRGKAHKHADRIAAEGRCWGERERGKKKNSDPAPRILPSRRVTCSQLSWLSKQVFSPLCKSTGGDGAASADGEGIGGEDSSQVVKREPKTLMLGAEGSPGPDERKVNSF